MKLIDFKKGSCRVKLTLNIYKDEILVESVKYVRFSRNSANRLRKNETVRLYTSLKMLEEYDYDIMKFLEDKQFLSFLMATKFNNCSYNVKAVLKDIKGHLKFDSLIKNKIYNHEA